MAIENPVIPLLPNLPGDEKGKAAGKVWSMATHVVHMHTQKLYIRAHEPMITKIDYISLANLTQLNS